MVVTRFTGGSPGVGVVGGEGAAEPVGDPTAAVAWLCSPFPPDAGWEGIYAALRRSGLAPRDVTVAYALLWHYTAGELLDFHHQVNGNYARRMVRAAADPQTYPALAEAIAAFPPGPPGDWFAENLQRLLDGLLR